MQTRKTLPNAVRTAAILLLLCACSAPLSAQVWCYGMPANSPVPSYSPSDVPATGFDILTYTGSHAKARVNHNHAYVQINDNEQRVWFAPDSNLHRTFYNRRYRAYPGAQWYWQYSVSPVVIDFGPNTSTGPGSVLYSATPKYVDTRNNETYEYMMFIVNQPARCNGVSGGFLYLAYSHDGICWTSIQQAQNYSAPLYTNDNSAGCWANTPYLIPLEAVSAFDAGYWVYVLLMEGDIYHELYKAGGSYFEHNDAFNRTFLYPVYMRSNNPSYVYPYPNNHEYEAGTAGLFVPLFYYDSPNPDRYKPYNYFFNMQAAYDPLTGDLYVGRGYPYPYDRGSMNLGDQPQYSVTPEHNQAAGVEMVDPATGQSVTVGGCISAPATLPNRIQLYKMNIGNNSLNNLHLGTWTFLGDFGGPYGFDNERAHYGVAEITPLQPGQTNVGRDYGALSFIRDGAGNVVRENGFITYLPADTIMQPKGHGPCHVTGLEGIGTGQVQ
jgi:hypothetical protein